MPIRFKTRLLVATALVAIATLIYVSTPTIDFRWIEEYGDETPTLRIAPEYGGPKTLKIPAKFGWKPVTKVFFVADFSWLTQEFSVAANNPYFKTVDGVLFDKDGATLIAYPPGKKGSEYVVPNGVKTIDARAFYRKGLKALKSFLVSANHPRFKTVDGVLFSKDGATLIAYPPGKDATEYVVPDGVKTIGEYAFADCFSLKSITLPDGLESIGFHAFAGCGSLESTTFSKGLKTIETAAFSGCESLKSITLPEGLETLEGCAFAGCRSLESTSLPEGLKTIGTCAFYGCESLKSTSLPEGLEYLGNSAFAPETTIVASPGTVGAKYAAENRLPVRAPGEEAQESPQETESDENSDAETEPFL